MMLEDLEVGTGGYFIFGDRDDFGTGFAPRDQIRVVFVRPNEDHGVGEGRTEHGDELIDRRSGAASTEQHSIVLRKPKGVAND